MIALAGSMLFVPSDIKQAKSATLRQQVRVLAQPRLLLVYAMTAVGYGGSFIAFTYFTPILQQLAGLAPGAVTVVMLVYGISVVAGNYWGGKVADRRRPIPALKLIFLLLAAVLFTLTYTAHYPWLAVATVLAWGAVAFGNVPGCSSTSCGRPSATHLTRWTSHRA